MGRGMTYQTVITAIVPIIQAGVPALVTVADANQIDTALVPPNICPAVLLRARPQAEAPIALGINDDCWWLDCTLWAYYPPPRDLLNDPTLLDWRQMVAQLEAALRTNLATGAADDSAFGTKVYISGREMQKQDFPNLNTGLGQIARRVRRSPLIREAVFVSFP